MPSEARMTARDQARHERMTARIRPLVSNAAIAVEHAYVLGRQDGEKQGRGQFDALYDNDVFDLLSDISDALIRHGEGRIDERLRKVINAMEEATHANT